jgi:hypothetical protein
LSVYSFINFEVKFKSGLFPESHGIVGNTIYDPEYNMKVKLQSGGLAGSPQWWNKTEPIWITAKSQVKKPRMT